eukprot:superscaffoldBa00000038_g699
MREELHLREQTILILKEQLQSLRTSQQQQPSITTNSSSQSEPQASTSALTDTRPSQQPAVTPTHTHSTTDSHREATTSRPSKTSGEEKIASDADVLILIDSNGKFVNENQLFPGHKDKPADDPTHTLPEPPCPYSPSLTLHHILLVQPNTMPSTQS